MACYRLKVLWLLPAAAQFVAEALELRAGAHSLAHPVVIPAVRAVLAAPPPQGAGAVRLPGDADAKPSDMRRRMRGCETPVT